MSLAAGKLDRRIRIERYTVTSNRANEDEKTWTAFAEVWAEVGYRGAREAPLAGEVAAQRIRRFVIRYSSSVASMLERGTKDRIEFPVGNGVYFDISEVNEIGRREGIEIFATARSDGGKA